MTGQITKMNFYDEAEYAFSILLFSARERNISWYAKLIAPMTERVVSFSEAINNKQFYYL